MARDIVPSSFWNFPRLRLPSIWEDEDDWTPMANMPGGVSISEDDKSIYVEAAIPGIKPEEVEVTFDKGIVWIKGESKEEDKTKKYYRKAASSFSYRVALPGDVDVNAEPDATVKNGIMMVKFVKSPKSQPKKIPVKIK